MVSEAWRSLAREIAQQQGHKYIRTEHLMLAWLRLHPDLIADYAITPDDVAQQMRTLSRPVCAADDLLTLSPPAQQTLATINSTEFPQAVLQALLRASPISRKLFTELHVSVNDLMGESDNAE